MVAESLQPGHESSRSRTISVGAGVALTGKPEVFLRSLPHLLPVRVQAEAQGGWRISAH